MHHQLRPFVNFVGRGYSKLPVIRRDDRSLPVDDAFERRLVPSIIDDDVTGVQIRMPKGNSSPRRRDKGYQLLVSRDKVLLCAIGIVFEASIYAGAGALRGSDHIRTIVRP